MSEIYHNVIQIYVYVHSQIKLVIFQCSLQLCNAERLMGFDSLTGVTVIGAP